MNKNVKIFHVISSFRRGGRERQLATIISNNNFNIYCTKIVYFNNFQNSYFDEYNLANTTIQIKSKGKLARLRELYQVLKSEKPDIVYTWGNGESISVLILKNFINFIFINGSIRHGIRSKNISHYLRTAVLHLSPFIVANSYTGLYVNYLRRGKVLYNGIASKFIGSVDRKQKIQKRTFLLGIESTQNLLISVANFVPYKDYFSIFEALKLIKEEGYYSFTYIILGDGRMRNNIMKYIQDLGLNDNIVIIGHVENVSDYLKISDIFIHSSKGEGCSNAILEAMAAGLPVIASDTGGTSEIVTNDTGRLFEFKNVDQLKSCIIDLLSNPALASKLGENALKIIRSRFTIPKMMEKYYEIINEVITK